MVYMHILHSYRLQCSLFQLIWSKHLGFSEDRERFAQSEIDLVTYIYLLDMKTDSMYQPTENSVPEEC